MDNMIVLGESRQAHLEAAKAAFFASGGRATDLGDYKASPIPARSAWVDPETVLARRRLRPTPAERAKLRKIAEAL